MSIRLVEMEEISTDSSGNQTLYSRSPIAGLVEAIRYVRNDVTAGASFTFTFETSGLAILTVSAPGASTTWYPRAQAVDASGSAIAGVYCQVPAVGDRIKLVITGGGANKTGRVFVLYHDVDQTR